MIRYKKIIMMLALLLTAVTGAWAEETPLVTITIGSDGNPVYSAEGLVTLTGTNYNTGSAGLYFWLPSDTKTTLSATVAAAADNVSITKVVFWSSDNDGGYNNPLEDTAAPYLCYANSDDSKRGKSLSDDFATKVDGYRIAKVEVYGTAEITEWDLTPDADKKVWTLDKMPANNIELQVEYEPTKVTMAVNDKTMGTVEVGGENKVEWTADTWNGWTSDNKTYTVDDITMTSSQNASIREITEAGDYLHSLSFFVNENEDNSTVTFSTTGDPFSRIEFTMIRDYNPGEGNYHGVPNIQPADGWTFSGKSAVWEGEATKSLTLKSCSTQVSKITFFKGATPDGVTINGDGTFTVAKTATVTLTATPAEGYKFLYWDDDKTNTNPVREVTIESGMDDMTYKAVFAEITYNVTFADGIEEADKWTATPNTEVKKETKVDIKYTGTKKVLGVKVEKVAVDNTYMAWDNDQDKLVEKTFTGDYTVVQNSNQDATWQEGTYVVEGQVKINGGITFDGNDGNVNLIIKDGAKLTVNGYINGASNNLRIYGQAQMTGELDVNCSAGDAISNITTLEVHSAEVTATASYDNCGGIFGIKTFKVYGGKVDAQNTGSKGLGIALQVDGSMNIYGGEVKAVGKGNGDYGYGIKSSSSSDFADVKVFGGKLWAENADNKALNNINLTKDAGFTGKIETSSDKSTWSETVDANAKYVRAGY